jgi:hypothetical protein
MEGKMDLVLQFDMNALVGLAVDYAKEHGYEVDGEEGHELFVFVDAEGNEIDPHFLYLKLVDDEGAGEV